MEAEKIVIPEETEAETETKYKRPGAESIRKRSFMGKTESRLPLFFWPFWVLIITKELNIH